MYTTAILLIYGIELTIKVKRRRPKTDPFVPTVRDTVYKRSQTE